MIPALWRLLWQVTGMRYLWEFLFGSWLVDRIWADESEDRTHNPESHNER